MILKNPNDDNNERNFNSNIIVTMINTHKNSTEQESQHQQQQSDSSTETTRLIVSELNNSHSNDGNKKRWMNPHTNNKDVDQRLYEMAALLRLAIPIFILQLSSVIPGFVVASYIGRHYHNTNTNTNTNSSNNNNLSLSASSDPGVTYLDGYTLATVTTNLCILSLLQGLYSAADTLSPQAYGAGNSREVGIVAIRGYLVSILIVSVPIAGVLLIYMQPLLLWFQQDPVSVEHASAWFQIYIIALPFYSLYQVTMKFLSAQNQMQPLLICCIVSTGIVLPTLLYIFGTAFGFIGTAITLVLYHVFNSLSLIFYLYMFQPHDPYTWPGFYDGIKHAIQYQPFMSYMALGVGGMLATSEWVYWETVALMIGTFGTIPLSVHTIPSQLIMIAFMGPFSFGIALSIRLGMTLPLSVSRAKQTTIDTFAVSIILFGLMAILMYVQQDSLVSLFTTSDAVIEGCREIWWKVCLFSFVLSIFGIQMGTCFGLGMQWKFGISTFVALWIIGLPSTYYFSVVRNGGINVAWSTIWPPYIVLVFSLTGKVVNADWDQIATDIRIREGVDVIDSRRTSTVSITNTNNLR